MKKYNKNIMKTKKLLARSLILVVSISLLIGCGAKSKEQKVDNLKFKTESKGQKIEIKDKIISRNKDITKLKKTKEKQVERKVKKLLKSMERKCKLCKDDLESIGWLIAPEWNKLEKIGSSAIPIMIDVLKDKKRDWRLRFFIAQMMWETETFQDKRFAEELIKIVKDTTDNVAVRANVANVVGRIGNKEIVEPLLRILEDEKDGSVRLAIVRSFPTFCGDERTINLMVKILSDRRENNIVRKCAAFKLGEIGGEKVIKILRNALKECKDGQVKVGIIWGLRSTKDPRAIDPLIEELRKGNFTAAEALGNLGKEMKGNDKDRIVEALIEGLKTYKENPDGLIWDACARALGQIEDKRAVKPLLKALENEDVIKRNTWNIINALGKIRDKRAIEPLEKVLQDNRYKDARRNILCALAQITGEDYKSLEAKFKNLRR